MKDSINVNIHARSVESRYLALQIPVTESASNTGMRLGEEPSSPLALGVESSQ